MNKFHALRNNIDALDAKLISLLQERANIVKQVKEFKDATHNSNFTLYIKPNREYEILIKVIGEANGYSKECFYNIWRGIISASNFLEQDLQLLSTCTQTQGDVYRHFGNQRIPIVQTNIHKAFEFLQANQCHILAFKEDNLDAFELLKSYTNIKIFSLTHSLDGIRTFLCGKISVEYFTKPAIFLTKTPTEHFFIEEAKTKIFFSQTPDGDTIGAFYPLPL